MLKSIKSNNNKNNMEGTRPPTGASPTQPYKCGQYVKIKIKIPPIYPTINPRRAILSRRG